MSHLTVEEKEQIQRLYASGMSTSDVGNAVGRAPTTVWSFLVAQGTPLRRTIKPVSPEDLDQFVALYLSGLSTRQVAKKTKRGLQTVSNALKSRGVMRKVGKERFLPTAGKVYGTWTVRGDYVVGSSGNTMWVCTCSCGLVLPRRASSLVKGYALACPGCSEPAYTNKYSFKGWYIAQVMAKAKQRGRDWSISLDALQEKWDNQEGRCALTGQDIKFSGIPSAERRQQTASLDRIDSKKGYIPGNVQWVHKTVNRIKSDLDEAEFVNLCRKVVATRDNKPS